MRTSTALIRSVDLRKAALLAIVAAAVALVNARAHAADPENLDSFAVGTASARQPAQCNMQLTVELTPDVPDASDNGFLSSLLNNHPGYRLELQRVIDPALVELDLSGPGPEYLCERVVDTMRKDARVLSVRTNNTGEAAPSVATTSQVPERMRVSETGLGALYWAARHPSQSWRVLLPVLPAEEAGEEAAQDAPKESAAPLP